MSHFMEKKNKGLDNCNLKCTLPQILYPFCHSLLMYDNIHNTCITSHSLVFMAWSSSAFKLKEAYFKLAQMPLLSVFIVSLI